MAASQNSTDEVLALQAQLREADHAYYVLSRPVMSDQDYDSRLARLVQLEAQFPQLSGPDSPTRRVGSDLALDFPERPHAIPVLSLDKAYSTAEILTWATRSAQGITELRVGMEEKIDGLSVVLYYKDGLLDYALTRGNGERGNDVSANIRTLREIPLRLSRPVSGAFRGEVYLRKDDFARLNAEQDPPYANPRNLAGGTLRRAKSSEVAKVPLRIYIYEGFYENSPRTHEALLEDLVALGFPVDPRRRFFVLPRQLDEVQAAIEEFTADRPGLDYDIDGLVFKVDDLEQREALGYTGHHPRWAIAFKFESPQGVSKVLGIDVQVGRTGRVTPLARIEPVEVGKTVIRNVTLHNQDYINALELGVGDQVAVSRRGDVIPAIESVVEKGENTAWLMPTRCPVCATGLVQEGAHLFCPNFDCPDRRQGRLAFFVARDQMDIEGLGPESLALLVREGFVKDVADLYNLPYEKILGLEGWGDKKVQRLREGIEASLARPFSRVLPSLGIPEIGSKFTELILGAGYLSMQALFDLADSGRLDELLAIKGIGEKTLSRLDTELRNPRLRELVMALTSRGLQFSQSEQANSPSEQDSMLGGVFSGQVWCATGTFENFKPREKAMEEVAKRGGKVVDDVTKATTHLLVGDKAGSKLEKARKFGAVLVNEEEFLRLLEQ